MPLIFELIYAAFFLLAVIAVSFDRAGSPMAKWVVLVTALAFGAIAHWSSWTFSGLFIMALSWDFWRPSLAYLGVGALYSLIEFAVIVRRQARVTGAAWKTFMDAPINGSLIGYTSLAIKDVDVLRWGDMIAKARFAGGGYANFEHAVGAVRVFALAPSVMIGGGYREHPIISLTPTDSKLEVEPVINKGKLADHIGAWTFLWPAYAVNLIFGDLLSEIFTTLANVLAGVAGKVVRSAFSSAMKA